MAGKVADLQSILYKRMLKFGPPPLIIRLRDGRIEVWSLQQGLFKHRVVGSQHVPAGAVSQFMASVHPFESVAHDSGERVQAPNNRKRNDGPIDDFVAGYSELGRLDGLPSLGEIPGSRHRPPHVPIDVSVPRYSVNVLVMRRVTTVQVAAILGENIPGGRGELPEDRGMTT